MTDEANVNKLIAESSEAAVTLKLGDSSLAGMRDIARYYRTNNEEVIRRLAILPAAVYHDVISEIKLDPAAKLKVECICYSVDSQIGYISLGWVKGPNSRKYESSLEEILTEPPKAVIDVKLGSGTKTGLKGLANYCKMSENDFLIRLIAIFAMTLRDVKPIAEFDSSADLKAAFIYISSDPEIVKGAAFIFRPGLPLPR